MKFIGIIPARYASTRFPGKPLADICHKPLIRRVYEQAVKALDTVVVATDDERIYDAVEAFGGKVVMTRADHRCGTDRCLEAYEAITTPTWRAQNDTDTVIVNIQGDEPFIQPEQIKALTDIIDDLCLGYKLPGAGGGGYLYMVAKDPEAAAKIKQKLSECPQNKNARFVDMSLSEKGLQISRS